jgi:hypothetical protein
VLNERNEILDDLYVQNVARGSWARLARKTTILTPALAAIAGIARQIWQSRECLRPTRDVILRVASLELLSQTLG